MMLQTVLTYKVYNPEKFKAQYEAEVAAKRAAKKEIKTVTDVYKRQASICPLGPPAQSAKSNPLRLALDRRVDFFAVCY